MAIILGLDPGSRQAGIGVLEFDRDRIRHLYHGVIDVRRSVTFYDRLVQLGQYFDELCLKYKPDVVVIEQIFLGKNADSAFKLGHARGVCMFHSLNRGAEVVEYATRVVKKTVTGHGGAEKEQVQRALEKLLQVQIEGAIDASDALALAYHHGVQMEIDRKLAQMKSQGTPTARLLQSTGIRGGR